MAKEEKLMKFFIPLGQKYDSLGYWSIGSVYGPFENDSAVQEEISRRWPNNKRAQFLVFDGQIVNVTPSPLEKPESEKREPGNTGNYVRSDCGLKCKDCGEPIRYGTVAHPIETESGSVQCEHIPYCPNCEKVPNYYGKPIEHR